MFEVALHWRIKQYFWKNLLNSLMKNYEEAFDANLKPKN